MMSTLRPQHFDGSPCESTSPLLRKSQKTIGNCQERRREHHGAATQLHHAPVAWVLGAVLVLPSQKGYDRAGEASGRMKDLEWLLQAGLYKPALVRSCTTSPATEHGTCRMALTWAGGRFGSHKRRVLLSGHVSPAGSPGTWFGGCDELLSV